MYRAFSVVVKDLQYSSLGLMLLGLLAQIKHIIRPLGKDLVVEEVEHVTEISAGDEQIVEVSRENEDMQDLGEVVSRDDLQTAPVKEVEVEEDEATMARSEPAKVTLPKSEPRAELENAPKPQSTKRRKEEKKKKKRKRGDAFDDLFDSLI